MQKWNEKKKKKENLPGEKHSRRQAENGVGGVEGI